MRAVVTGATSFIGSAVVRKLLEAGCQVCAVVRPMSRKLHRLPAGPGVWKQLTVLECGMEELHRLPALIDGSCDVFLHFGWGGSGSEARKDVELQRRNVLQTVEAVEAAAALGCRRFLFSGSQAEYGMFHHRMGEEDFCHPLSEYGKAKLEVLTAAGGRCLERGMDYGHIRIFSLYGPGDHPWSLVSSCMEAFQNDQAIQLGSCESRWNFLYIDDGAEAFLRLTEYPGRLMEEGPVYNLAGGETRPLKFFVETMHELCRKKGSYVYGVRPPNAEGEIELIPDISKICRILPWEPETDFRRGIGGMAGNDCQMN